MNPTAIHRHLSFSDTLGFTGRETVILALEGGSRRVRAQVILGCLASLRPFLFVLLGFVYFNYFIFEIIITYFPPPFPSSKPSYIRFVTVFQIYGLLLIAIIYIYVYLYACVCIYMFLNT